MVSGNLNRVWELNCDQELAVVCFHRCFSLASCLLRDSPVFGKNEKIAFVDLVCEGHTKEMKTVSS